MFVDAEQSDQDHGLLCPYRLGAELRRRNLFGEGHAAKEDVPMLLDRQTNRHFDSVVILLLNAMALPKLLIGELPAALRSFREVIVLEARGTVGLNLVCQASSILGPLRENSWPASVDLSVEASGGTASSEIRREWGGAQAVTVLVLQSAFLRFYEMAKQAAVESWGSTPDKWPAVWRFGWVIRNACGHDGRLGIGDPTFREVTWKSLSYSHTHDGRQVFGTDLGPAEVVFLMGEMDAALGRGPPPNVA